MSQFEKRVIPDERSEAREILAGFCWGRIHASGELITETFEKGSILSKVKESEDFNRRNIRNISRIEIRA